MRRSFLALVCLAAITIGFGPALAEGDDALDEARRLLRAGKDDQAKAVLEAYVKETPQDGLAWITLANIYHTEGDYETAVQMNRKAAETLYVRGSAKYNEACALSLLGRVDEANDALQDAVAAGFLDYDLIATDGDLAALRAKHKIAYPPENKYDDFTARNSVKLAYKVLLPRRYDAGKSYPAVVVFSPGEGRRSADWAMKALVGSGDDTKGWIVIYAIGPEDGWFTHPSHHALNDLLKDLKSRYRVDGDKFHVAGFGEGARVATTYSRMSEEYFQTLTCFSGWHWERWDRDELSTSFRGVPVCLVVGERDPFGREQNAMAKSLLEQGGAKVELDVVAKDDHMLMSIRHGKMLDYLPLD